MSVYLFSSIAWKFGIGTLHKLWGVLEGFYKRVDLPVCEGITSPTQEYIYKRNMLSLRLAVLSTASVTYAFTATEP
jgi:hypothetical protein